MPSCHEQLRDRGRPVSERRPLTRDLSLLGTGGRRGPHSVRRPHTGQERPQRQRGDCVEGEAREAAEEQALDSRAGRRALGARGARARGRAGAAAGRPTSPPRRRALRSACWSGGAGRRASGLTSEFELVLRLEAQDLLHLRHVPRRRDTSGGETPERSPEAAGVNAAPTLNLERGGGRPGRGRGSPTGCARGGPAYAVQAQGRRARVRPRCPASARHARTHARSDARTHAAGRPPRPGERSGGGELSAPSPPIGQCAGAALAAGAGLPDGRGWGVAQVRGRGGCGTPRIEDRPHEDYFFSACGGQALC